MHLIYYIICIYEIYSLILHHDSWSCCDCWLRLSIARASSALHSPCTSIVIVIKNRVETSAEGQGVGKAKSLDCSSWTNQYPSVSKLTAPLINQGSSQGDNSQSSSPCKGSSSQKPLPMQREQPRGQFSKLLPWVRGGAPKGQRGMIRAVKIQLLLTLI